jgi:tetratricopeptide (TPR) repeat protein/predicted aspartyl protease
VLLEGVFDREQLAVAAAAQFELVVHTTEQIDLLRTPRPGTRFKVWLKLDSGMNRLGFKGTAFGAAHAALSALGGVQAPVNLFTHLASADLPDLPTTAEQLALFAAATRNPWTASAVWRTPPPCSASRSTQADWVRPGLLLYGVSPFAGSIGADYGLRPAMTLRSHVIAIKDLSPGERVGYGGDWTALSPTRLAVAAVGYGDGYPRNLASGAPVLVNGERAGLAGRVSMDMIGIDVTDVRARRSIGRSGRALGRGIAGGGNRGMGGHHSLRAAVRNQPTSRGQFALSFDESVDPAQTCSVRPTTRRLSTMRLGSTLVHCVRIGAVSLSLVILSTLPPRAFASCKLGKMAELPITMSGSKPELTAQINGEDARFVADSGAFYSMMTEASAAQYKLSLRPAPFGFGITGVGGTVTPSIANVKVFTIAGVPIKNVEFLVGGSEVGGSGSAGLLGQNFFRIGDVEYDLANGVIRLMHPNDCKHTNLAYWVKGTEAYSIMDVAETTIMASQTEGTAYVNGAKIRVMFDTGAGTSALSLKAAERAGVKPDSPGVVDAGYSHGIGRAMVKTYIGPFASFKIGGEEIRNTRLRFGETGVEKADMLLGVDFFLSHRIYVARSQNKLYFTYNGGPVFNLATSQAPKPEAGKEGDEPADAAAYSRRGTALTARRDFEHAIADLTRACELEPTNAEYFYQRGVAYGENRQIDLSAADIDRAIELNPDHIAAHLARAQLRLMHKDKAGAIVDLGAADRLAPKEADIRFYLARDYESLDLLAESAAQFDLWIPVHGDDSKMAVALNGRCWVRAMQGQELAKGLSDCNDALSRATKGTPFYARILNSRGLVRLRLGDYDKSIADYDASLKLSPMDAGSYYGRGIDKLRKNKAREGEADIAEAVRLKPTVTEDFARRGVNP